MDYNKTGNLIQKIRKEKNMTQMELASKLGVTDRAISKWETGRGFPDVSLLESLAEILGISVTELLDGEQAEGCEITADAAEEAAIRGIKTYLGASNRKIRILCAVLAAMMVILASVGLWEYVRYSRRPIDFQNDNMDFGHIVYIDADKEKHEFNLDGSLGNELKVQILTYLKNEMMQGTELAGGPEGGRSDKTTQVQLTGLITFYSDCYYDQKSDKYYILNWMEEPFRKMTGLCEELISDEYYEYTGPKHFENQGCTLDVNCTLTEKPMELIVDYYRRLIDQPRDDEHINCYRSYIIDKIERIPPAEYEEIYEFTHYIAKEIPYRGLYNYRVYKVTVTFKDTPEYRKLGSQYPEGTYQLLFMAGRSVSDERMEIQEEYVSMLGQVKP
ncbi:MAG: helix-turn-helix domain-containing protein [Anaerovoracaceae bacterium]